MQSEPAQSASHPFLAIGAHGQPQQLGPTRGFSFFQYSRSIFPVAFKPYPLISGPQGPWAVLVSAAPGVRRAWRERLRRARAGPHASGSGQWPRPWRRSGVRPRGGAQVSREPARQRRMAVTVDTSELFLACSPSHTLQLRLDQLPSFHRRAFSTGQSPLRMPPAR